MGRGEEGGFGFLCWKRQGEMRINGIGSVSATKLFQ